jgi:hypothetical protein
VPLDKSTRLSHDARVAKVAGVFLLAFALAPVALPDQAHAADAAPADATLGESGPSVGQRNIGVLASIGSFSGFGAGMQVGTSTFGLRLVAGWNPLFASVQEPGDDTPSIEFYSSWMAAPDLYLSLLESKKGAHAGAQLGYRYDSELKHGFAIGGYGSMRVAHTLEGIVQGGLLIYPNGEEELIAGHRELAGSDFSFPGPGVSFGVSLALALFP